MSITLEGLLETARTAAEHMRKLDVEMAGYVKAGRGNSGQLAQMLGVSPTYISDITNGKRRMTIRFAERLAMYFAPEWGLDKTGNVALVPKPGTPGGDLLEPEVSMDDGMTIDEVMQAIERRDLVGVYRLAPSLALLEFGVWLVQRAKLLRAFGRDMCVGKLDALVAQERERVEASAKAAARFQKTGRPDDPWTDQIMAFIARKDNVSVREVLTGIGVENQDQIAANRVAYCLRLAGWTQYRRRVGDRVERRYRSGT